jgi:very-short-patch-repair endonuclease
MKVGIERLREQLDEYIDGEWGWQFEEAVGDSPIEKLLFFSLSVLVRHTNPEHNDMVIATSEDQVKDLTTMFEGESLGRNRLVVYPQAPFRGRRVDFQIYALDWRGPRTAWKWRTLLVECDGHNFHERTREQATRDKRKDRHATLDGIDTFRFSGSDIWRDPWGCAREIMDWAVKGYGP